MYCGGTGMLGSLAARYLPGFGFKPFQPQQAKAVYIPAWIIDAEVEAKFWVRTNQNEEAAQVKMKPLEHRCQSELT